MSNRFFSITKPGIIFGNLVAMCGGYFLGTHGDFSIALFFSTALGISLIVASGCVLNNVIDKDIDSLMERTQRRVMVRGLISAKIAIGYGIFLGCLGFLLLIIKTNWLTVLMALIGFIVYVVVYTLGLKRKSTYGTLIGAVAGAVPPMVGYCAVTDRFDSAAILLFAILFFWQMPHFYAIAIYRLKDYQAAAIPTLPTQKSITYTKMIMALYIIAFTITCALLWWFGYTGKIYLAVSLLIGLVWFGLGIKGFFLPPSQHTPGEENRLWARQMFLLSIIIIMVLCVMMGIK